MITLSDELLSCIPDQLALIPFEQPVIGDALTSFLRTLPEEKRLIFMRRYWFSDSIDEIAKGYHMTESKVKTSLHRTRNKLKAYLESEGITI